MGILKTTIAILGALAALPAYGLHRCTTADGKVTYTEFTCDTGAKASGVEIHDSSGMEVGKRTNSFSYSKGGTPKAAAASPAAQRTPSQEQAERNIKCRQAQSNNRVLNTPRPVYTIKKGKTEYLDDSQRDAAIERQRQEIASNCK